MGSSGFRLFARFILLINHITARRKALQQCGVSPQIAGSDYKILPGLLSNGNRMIGFVSLLETLGTKAKNTYFSEVYISLGLGPYSAITHGPWVSGWTNILGQR